MSMFRPYAGPTAWPLAASGGRGRLLGQAEDAQLVAVMVVWVTA
ncbi:hypothetical protein ACFYXM_11005 [Streptomyces sp. NPDC002476]